MNEAFGAFLETFRNTYHLGLILVKMKILVLLFVIFLIFPLVCLVQFHRRNVLSSTDPVHKPESPELEFPIVLTKAKI